MPGQCIDALNDLVGRHEVPFVPILRQDRIKCVAPRAAKIAARRSDKDSRAADQRTFALDGWTEDFADANVVAHLRYSAQVFGVSETRTAVVSGHRSAHQSNSHLQIDFCRRALKPGNIVQVLVIDFPREEVFQGGQVTVVADKADCVESIRLRTTSTS